MKTSDSIIIILIIISVIVLSGCVSSKHYDNKGISFDYPSNWNTSQHIFDLPGAMVIVYESSQADVKIFKYDIPSGSSLEEAYHESITNHSSRFQGYCYQQVSNRTITVAGVQAYEIVFQIGCNSTQTRQKIREIWLEKNGTIFTIICTVIPPEDFTTKDVAFNQIINSFQVKS
ncbi:MAG: hypothetical protein LLF83_02865 [Methanobacterium sp.]|nr:hypothetical protein [Methanobacterium sp.]